MNRETRKKRVATHAVRGLVLVSFFIQSANFIAQQGASRQGASNGVIHKIVPKSGIWIVKSDGDKPFYFEIKNGVLTGQAGVSYAVSCGGFTESQTDYSIDLSKIGGRTGHMKTMAPLRYITPNSFVAVLSPGDRDDNIKIKITWKGSFTSTNSASGTLTVSCSVCDRPLVSSWTASLGS